MPDYTDPLIDSGYKGFPHHQPPLRRSAIGSQGWNVLRGDLPLPLAVIRRDALAANLHWMQGFAREHGADMAPHGKTTMSPQLFQRQLQAGAWGITFATVGQARVGIDAGVRNCLIANQVLSDADLDAIVQLRRQFADLRIVFLHGDRALLAQRLGSRSGHYMPPSLLQSQLDTLEPPGDDEAPIRLDIAVAPPRLVEQALQALENPS